MSLMGKLFLLPAIILSFTMMGCNGDSSSSDSNSTTTTQKIGVLLPLSGDLSGAGQTFKTALELAANKQSNCELVIKDSESSFITAETRMGEFKAEGIEMIIGPAGSEAARSAKNYANQNGQTLLSCSSTAVALAIPNDSLFRFAVPDTAQAEVLADKLSESGITHLAMFVQTDIYGSGLAAGIRENFEKSGGTIFANYSMRGAANIEDMNYILNQFLTDLDPVLQTVDESQVGVVLVMYEQAITLMQAADNFDTLHRLSWFGTDSLALSIALTNNAVASSFAVRTDFRCPLTAEFTNTEYQTVKNEISDALGGPASVYAVMYHDALLIVSSALEQAGSQTPEAIRPALREVATAFSGATGPITLDANDDRSSHMIYNFWKVSVNGGSYVWSLDSKKEIL